MGQYHKIYNIDKKEMIHPHNIDNGLKQYEQVGWIGSSSTALFALLCNSNCRGGGDFPEHAFLGRWAGDRIVIQGDYAEPTDQAYIEFSEEENEGFINISNEIISLLETIERSY